MGKKQAAVSIFMAAVMVVMSADLGEAKKNHRDRGGRDSMQAGKRDRVARDFMHVDTDGDRQLARAEWNRGGDFNRLDKNGAGILSLEEVRVLYKGHDDKDYDWPPNGMQTPVAEIDPSVKADRVGREAMDNETLCGIGQERGCGIDPQKMHGLVESGTGPRFPDNAKCPGIDDYWATDYASKRNIQSYHGGIDVPVPWGTPARAVAAGSVVAKYEAHQSKRGTEVVLRHGPEQTGLPM